MRPRLEIVVELEERPRVRIRAARLEDEQRLGRWLERYTVRRRVLAAIKDALDDVARPEA